MQSQRSKLVFSSQRLETIDPDVVMKGVWVSTAIALILTLPPLGIFLGVWHSGGNLIIGTIIGFGLHFVLLALSEKISSILLRLFE